MDNVQLNPIASELKCRNITYSIFLSFIQSILVNVIEPSGATTLSTASGGVVITKIGTLGSVGISGDRNVSPPSVPAS
jgi:hypothetical protein